MDQKKNSCQKILREIFDRNFEWKIFGGGKCTEKFFVRIF